MVMYVNNNKYPVILDTHVSSYRLNAGERLPQHVIELSPPGWFDKFISSAGGPLTRTVTNVMKSPVKAEDKVSGPKEGEEVHHVFSTESGRGADTPAAQPPPVSTRPVRPEDEEVVHGKEADNDALLALSREELMNRLDQENVPYNKKSGERALRATLSAHTR